MQFDPNEMLESPVVVLLPHMDDGVLACGGLLAQFKHKDSVHIVYATDGGRPARDQRGLDGSTDVEDYIGRREQEAIHAFALLGYSADCIRFWSLPDGDLSKHREVLNRLISDALAEYQPKTVLFPSRFDRPLDHRVLSEEARKAASGMSLRLVEYYVYRKLKLLPGRDVRSYVRREYLFSVDTAEVQRNKSQALAAFTTQIKPVLGDQRRPILSADLLDVYTKEPESFLIYTQTDEKKLFRVNEALLIATCKAEDLLKRWKHRLFSL